MAHTGPLAGIRILEFSQIVAGPFAGVALSDMGADIIKVEPLRGEDRRNSGAVVPNEGKYFQSLNRGKRSLTVDLGTPDGQALIHRIIPGFDVVLLNYRAGVAERLNIGYERLSAINPRLVYANITGFGEKGPHVHRAGSDIVAQAYSGLMAAEGKVDEHGAPQSLQSSTFIDRTTGLAAAMGICAALLHRERTGKGQELHVSLLQTALELLSDKVMREPVHDSVLRDPLIAELHEKRDSGARYDEIADVRKQQAPRFASHRLFYGGYHTRRGAIVLGALTMQNRNTIRRILGLDDTTDTAGFNAADPENRRLLEAWRESIQAKLLERDAEEWVATFIEAGVPASVVQQPEDLADDPHVVAAGMMIPMEHAMTGPQQVVGPLVHMSLTPTEALRPAPPLASHTREVLLECGLDESDVGALVAAGVISTAD
ncbi:MAG: CoA transferase [Dehalococcoidia bacterium]|uniref:CaiB/BaiF CoA transferase family protein n=1 Tax=Candidatus Amarobacter glycogenicus TaxID=3140699 RepID=UPI002A0DBA1E|nr:CoA transferase [Dehalococcoidia bacterium]MBK7327983.1 CoA transferase [Dehalococcoidia bacterium]MBK9544264.1 CoA transferase [Dehalococcoidia bacterium]MBK9610574.1 CoA transferase [Dehalococcoidia bacterium]MCC6266287.1 CoA transferase [Dehalococcoidia bacterium]